MDEEKLILDALSGIALPEDVKRIELKFAPDSTGVPPVWINLHIDDDYHPSDARIAGLSMNNRPILRAGSACAYLALQGNAIRWTFVIDTGDHHGHQSSKYRKRQRQR